MLRMTLLGLLIPLGVGALAAMELRTPPRNTVAIVEPLAETTAGITDSAGISDSHGALAKADRLEVVAVSSEAPAQAVLVDDRIARPEDVSVGASEPPRPIARHQHNPKPKKVTIAARPKSKPKAAEIKRATVPRPSRIASDTGACRLSAFGGLRKALNSTDCEI
jgi:hypothetical protein